MKKTNKKVVFIAEYDVLNSRNSYLKNRLCVEKTDIEEGYISDLWIDCDYVKLYNEEGRGNFPFVKVENKSTIYIITETEYDEDFDEVIYWWLNGSENELEIENNWNDWNTINKGVAYRGGSGYTYALYAME